MVERAHGYSCQDVVQPGGVFACRARQYYVHGSRHGSGCPCRRNAVGCMFPGCPSCVRMVWTRPDVLKRNRLLQVQDSKARGQSSSGHEELLVGCTRSESCGREGETSDSVEWAADAIASYCTPLASQKMLHAPRSRYAALTMQRTFGYVYMGAHDLVSTRCSNSKQILSSC
jgi:hypothetical protein